MSVYSRREKLAEIITENGFEMSVIDWLSYIFGLTRATLRGRSICNLLDQDWSDGLFSTAPLQSLEALLHIPHASDTKVYVVNVSN